MGKKLIRNIASFFLVSGLVLGCAIVDPPSNNDEEQGGGSSGGEDKPVASLSDLVVTELHYHPYHADTSLVDEFEFVELHNKGKSDLSLANIGTDGIDFQFASDAKIKAGEYLVIASNSVRFEERYGFKPFGQYDKNLKNSGETFAVKEVSSGKNHIIIDYKDLPPWPIEADGDGYSLVPISDSTFSNYSNGALWRKSFKMHGSPGAHDPAPVFVNEVSAHTDTKQGDAIELYNPNDFEVDLGGWYLSDSRIEPAKYRIPDGTKIGAKGYTVFYSGHFDTDVSLTSFGLSENGDEVYLFSDATANAYVDGFIFDATDNGVTYGRYVNSVGAVVYTTLAQSTLGAANSEPFVSSTMVITEIMYNPQSSDAPEYVEIKNISENPIDLWYSGYPEKVWKIGGFGAKFPQNTSVKSGEVVVITTMGTNEEKFRAAYPGIPDGVQIFCIGEKALSNGGERISIMQTVKPDSGFEADNPNHKELDGVEYSDEGLWAEAADANGSSLIRKDLALFANDPSNWKADKPTPGVDNR